ncbi:hypothetical protein P7C73_g4898, partial [Tremellales sp. Uapishka_1]
MATKQLPLLCFNDVYRVNQRFVPQPGSPPETSSGTHISVAQFGQLLLSEREKWKDGKEGKEGKEGLVLFAGDVFNPSVESSVTRGSHMVPVMNALKIDVACVGNHDFDFGYPHLTTLIASCNFPWLLSNIVDKTTNEQPTPFLKYWITERCGLKIGVVGLVEEDWIATIPSWPQNFVYRSMKDTALEISRELRDPNGQHKVDIIIALTHSRVNNDIELANQLGAVQGKEGVENEQGVDLLVGGHDHIGKGADSWDGCTGERDQPGTEGDHGVRLIKSGTDFRDLSAAMLTLTPTPPNSTRAHLISSLTGKHHYVLPSSPTSKPFESLTQSLLSTVSSTLSKPVCFTLTPFDARSEVVRTRETGLGNWIADVLIHGYAESLIEGGRGGEKLDKDGKPIKEKANKVEKEETEGEGLERDGGADAVIICGGTLRGDSQYGPGKITLGDILEILPFEDPVVVLELFGRSTGKVFGIPSRVHCRNGLPKKGMHFESTMRSGGSPKPVRRFPIVSGLFVEWDHTRPPLSRVLSIKLVKHPKVDDDEVDVADDRVNFVDRDDGTRVEVKQRKILHGEEVKNESGGRIYRVITREYMAQGYDGFEPLKNRKFVVDDETGQIMSSIIRSFLLGSSYIFRHKQLMDKHETHLSTRTGGILERAMSRTSQTGGEGLEKVPTGNSTWSTLRHHVVSHDWKTIRDALHVAKNEHVSSVDCLEGRSMRKQKTLGDVVGDVIGRLTEETKDEEADLAIVSPMVDNRLRNVAQVAAK